jgi:hypothetical protein
MRVREAFGVEVLGKMLVAMVDKRQIGLPRVAIDKSKSVFKASVVQV